uniref:G_PROTEIN_RECEP_F1_2 domain-containing protein n=1 Tax=Haemonchus contortus TaxID=6289 RepID=A0A7I4Y228_HAECO
MLYLYIAHSFLIIITLTIHLAYYFFTDPCTFSIPSAVCSGLHFPAVCCMLSFVILQFFMVVERSVALWKRLHYESYGPKLAVTLVLLSVILPPTTVILAMGGLHSPETHIFCGFADGDSGHNLIGFTSAMGGINLITLIIATILLFLNRLLSQRKSFDLNSSYQLREGATIIRIILPLTSFQTTFCAVYFGCILAFLSFEDVVDKVTYLILNAATYIIPYYTVVSPILMWFTIRWSQQLKQSRLKNIVNQTSNDYFNAQKKMWQ